MKSSTSVDPWRGLRIEVKTSGQVLITELFSIEREKFAIIIISAENGWIIKENLRLYY